MHFMDLVRTRRSIRRYPNESAAARPRLPLSELVHYESF
jgi:nitroreductase